jgi:hypothetical protein
MHRSCHGPLRQARGIIQRHAVEVADAHDDLERVAQSAARCDGYRDGPAQRAPDRLHVVSDATRGRTNGDVWVLGAHHCDGLDAEHEDVGRQIARVGEGIFLPRLCKNRLEACKGRVVPYEVP